MLKTIICSFLALGMLCCASAADVFKVLEVKGPSTVVPGQKITDCKIVVEVVEIDGKNYLRPDANFYFPKEKIGRNLRGDEMKPWQIKNFKVGDKITLGAEWKVPGNVPVGSEGYFLFRLYRSEKRAFAKLTGITPIVRFKAVDANAPAAQAAPEACTCTCNCCKSGKCQAAAEKK